MSTFTHERDGLTVHLVEAGMQNYIYIAEWGGSCVVIDPAEDRVVSDVLATKGLVPGMILATHDHGDHVAGIPGLKKEFGCPVVGPAGASVPGMDRELGEGDEVKAGPLQFRVLNTSGHSPTDISFYDPALRVLWCGDTLFSGGCGRLFTGDAEKMWSSLAKLAALPDDTTFFCGHEYTESNLRFAQAMDPDATAIADKLNQVEALRADGRPTLPGTIGEEKQINLFLRSAEPHVADLVGMPGADPAHVFAELRRRKDRF